MLTLAFNVQQAKALAAYGRELGVPFKTQYPPGTSWDDTKNCGQTSSLMVFCYYWNTTPTVEGIKNIDDWLHETYGDPINNYNGWYTTTTKLARLAREYAGFSDSYKASGWNLDRLKQEIDAGHPVIVAITAGKIPYRQPTDPEVNHYRNYEYTGGHFVVVKGYAEYRGISCIICNDPGTVLGEGKCYYASDFKAAMDDQGGAVVVVVSISKKPPVASFAYSPHNPVVGEKVTFDASSSYDPDGGTITNYRWVFYRLKDGGIIWPPIKIIEGADKDIIYYSFSSKGEYLVVLTVTDDEGATSSTSEIVKVYALKIEAYSPVDLVVTDPDELTISKELNEIEGAFYFEEDINGDGVPDDFIVIPERKIGDYLITVVPEPDAELTETYTLEVSANYTTIILAESVLISDIPILSYVVRSTDTEIIPIIQTTINFDPEALNLDSKGQWDTVYIELPVGHGYNVSDINFGSIMLNVQVQAEAKPIEIGDYDEDGIPDLMVKFNRTAVQSILEVGEKVEITISGTLIDGRVFEGKDTIKVILPP